MQFPTSTVSVKYSLWKPGRQCNFLQCISGMFYRPHQTSDRDDAQFKTGSIKIPQRRASQENNFIQWSQIDRSQLSSHDPNWIPFPSHLNSNCKNQTSGPLLHSFSKVSTGIQHAKTWIGFNERLATIKSQLPSPLNKFKYIWLIQLFVSYLVPLTFSWRSILKLNDFI